MALRGILETKVGEATVGDQLYVPSQIQRDTIYAYAVGQPVFELTSPELTLTEATARGYRRLRDPLTGRKEYLAHLSLLAPGDGPRAPPPGGRSAPPARVGPRERKSGEPRTTLAQTRS